jgi:hypothetical protein
MTGATSGAGTANPSGIPKFIPTTTTTTTTWPKEKRTKGQTMIYNTYT